MTKDLWARLLRSPARDQHLNADREPSVGLELREPGGHFRSDSAAVRLGKCNVCLRHGSDAGLNWFPIVVDTFDGALADLALQWML
jgi:hypothetical protein